jgi:hypothetical protein
MDIVILPIKSAIHMHMCMLSKTFDASSGMQYSHMNDDSYFSNLITLAEVGIANFFLGPLIG